VWRHAQLEGTRQIFDVKDTPSADCPQPRTAAAEAEGGTQLLRIELTRKESRLVGDVRILLLDTNDKKKSYGVRIVVDDHQLEKKNRTVKHCSF
jgi:hypothetical protein